MSKLFRKIMAGFLSVAMTATMLPNIAMAEETPSLKGAQIQFLNMSTKDLVSADVNEDGTYTVDLPAGYDFRAILNGVTGYGISSDTKDFSTTIDDALTGKSNVNFNMVEKKTINYTGKITGFAADYDVSGIAVEGIADPDSSANDAMFEIDKDLNFSAVMDPDVEYTLAISGVNDYEITSKNPIVFSESTKQDITVALKAMYDVKGGFLNLDGAKVTALSFENVDDGYIYTADVTDAGYSVKLRDGAYVAKATVDGMSTSTHVVVNGATVNKDLFFVSTAKPSDLERVPDLYVGYKDNADSYETVSEAVAAAERMNPSSEAERITIHIYPGTYREQIMINKPYISFVNDESGKVLLTWYYGIDYAYYSADENGYYNAQKAYDKYDKHGAATWGTAVYIGKNAKGFRAKNIVFENSFNRYFTDEELEDGVELVGAEGNVSAVRDYGLDVAAKSSTERACAVAIYSDETEFSDCKFYGSQDTLFTGNADYHVYFNNCLIEGQTDFIFGDANVVFDRCNLSWKGYSTGSVGGYLTAFGSKGLADKGYLFRNCTVTGNSDATVTPGYFGRPWSANAKVTFLNTKLDGDLIVKEGWTKMSNNEPTKANFKEYNTTKIDGSAVDTADRVVKPIEATAADTIKVADYFGPSWKPSYYKEEAAEISFSSEPIILDNGDRNIPKPGHTLTVGYSLGEANDANDVSIIKWYAGDTIVKLTNATVSRSYKVRKEDSGKTIKVEVIPVLTSGKSGTAASAVLENVIGEGYDDPSASAAEIALGDGVNVFLAGDSTVKDYSAAGMYTKGSAQDEGSWGEFLQSFFDEKLVKIQNYANGGRSTRNFINEGKLDEIKNNIGKDDYLFIQFGHNDCYEADLDDRYVAIGAKGADGKYPVTAGEKLTTPGTLKSKYGETCYTPYKLKSDGTYDKTQPNGTYKWYLKQYVDAAKSKGAIPVLVTPVSRLYYQGDGTIKIHHCDSTDKTADTYVEAVKQLAEEENVICIDAFGLTKAAFEAAYKAGGNEIYGSQVMAPSDSTHCNKLGGMIEAMLMAKAIKASDMAINVAVKKPTQVIGKTTTGKTVFSIDSNGALKAFDSTKNFTENATYWEQTGNAMIADIASEEPAVSEAVSEEEIAVEEIAVEEIAVDEEVVEIESAEEMVEEVAVSIPMYNTSNETVVGASEKVIDIWDFAGLKVNKQGYVNNITADTFAEKFDDNINAGKFIQRGEAKFGDLTWNFVENDRMYSSILAEKNAAYSVDDKYKNEYSDYTAGGAYYCNGTGGTNYRYAEIANVKAGDIVVAYVGSSDAKDTHYHFIYEGPEGSEDVQDDEVVSLSADKKVRAKFIAKYAGTYKLYADAAGGKPIYNRIMRIPAVTVTGRIGVGIVDTSAGTGDDTGNKPGTDADTNTGDNKPSDDKKPETKPISPTALTDEKLTSQNNKREEIASSAGGEVKIQQADGDTIVVEETIKNKKTKSLKITLATDAEEDAILAGDYFITLNGGSKYIIEGNFSIISALDGDGAEIPASTVKKYASAKAKKGNTTLNLKAVKYADTYKLHLQSDDEKANIYVSVEILSLEKKSIVTPDETKTIGLMVGDKDAKIRSAVWTCGKDVIPTIKASEAADKAKTIAKGRATAYVDASTGKVVVKIAESAKGNVKITATVNKKKYNTTLKIAK